MTILIIQMTLKILLMLMTIG